MATNTPSEGTEDQVKTSELKALGFIVVVLFPLLAVGFVGFYGLCVFLYNTFGGMPGHN
ncbi:periplasmic nitrate reductase, NapE protein [Shewanella corallii]|uniref:Periplasmic nitrate reductase, NapE protein n=2 Tax=Shewanella TaxID=22 RepID=A0ABT0N725_9GAMM|nr:MULTISPECIES: periplasmic nitrate reductase, NapE protein [Shewanella]MCL1037191.1 periplasmic nitrate reductase, NapE protein [Shewanella submarina]MCL2913681.1 periplasmic nitrate reductase, NapE protein [Shewanella corallii]